MVNIDHARPVILVCVLLAAISLSTSGYSQTSVITGYIGVNQYSNWYKNNNSLRYRGYSEDKSGARVISVALLKADGKKRRSIELSLLKRALVVNTYSGGLAGGGSHEINMDLTYMNFSGFIGRRVTKTMPLYLDFGGYIGIPLVRNVADNYRISIMPPFDMNNGIGTNDDPNEYLAKLEFGAILKAGFQLKLTEKIALSTALRLHCGVGGKADFNQIAFDQLAMIGIGYILEKRQ